MSFTVRKEIRGLKLKEAAFPISHFKGKRLKDFRGTAYIADWKDLLSFNLAATTVNAYSRKFSTALGIQEAHNKKTIKPIKEILGIGVLKINNAQQVLSDLRFYDKVLNETNFDETFTPFGYSKWKKMITGDYIYQKALCKYVMQASLNADRPNARVYTHKVDVPDLLAQGTVELTVSNQPREVHFPKDRTFHIVPEMNISIKSYSGTGATPLVLAYNVTTKGFMVVMKNEDGGYVEGTITYAARGY